MQVIKLLKRIVRRLRLLFCGLFTRPTAPRRAPWASLIPSNPESAPKSGEILKESGEICNIFGKSHRLHRFRSLENKPAEVFVFDYVVEGGLDVVFVDDEFFAGTFAGVK